MIFHDNQRNLLNLPSHITNDDSEVKINNISIERVDKFSFLGLTLNTNLTWQDHINKISCKISKTVGIMNSIKYFLPEKTLKTIYNALIVPHLYYGILLWGFECQKVEISQKKCIRLITNSYFNEHTEKLFKSLSLLKIEDIFKYKQMILYFKFMNNTLPNHITCLFSRFTPTTAFTIRNQTNKLLHEPNRNTRAGETSLSFSIPKLINNLNAETLELFKIENIHTFKRKLRQTFINGYQDSICMLSDCFACNHRLFYPRYLPKIFQYLSIFAYFQNLSVP